MSILPEKAEPIAMDFLKRHQDFIRKHIQKNSRISRVPWLRFTLDRGEKNRQIVEELLLEDAHFGKGDSEDDSDEAGDKPETDKA